MTKSWRSLNQRLANWRDRSKSLPRKRQGFFRFGGISDRSKKVTLSDALVMIFFALVFLTFVTSYRFYNQPQLVEGKLAPDTIVAPETASFEDEKTTSDRRKQVQTGIIPRLERDEETTEQIYSQIEEYLIEIENLRNATKPFPVVASKLISNSSQKYLRSRTKEEFAKIIDLTDQNVSQEETLLKRGEEKTSTELRAYKEQTSPEIFAETLIKLENSRERYAQIQQGILAEPASNFSEEEITILLDLDESTWNRIQTTLKETTEKILTQGIAPGVPESMLEQTVNLQLGSSLPEEVSLWAQNTILRILEPNLQEDREATLRYAEKAVEAIEPVVIEINKGETIVQEGEIIDRSAFVLLDGFDLSRRSINWRGIEITAGIVALAIATFVFCQQQTYANLRHRDYFLLCSFALSAPMLSILQVPYTNLPALGLFISSFYSPLLAVCLMSLFSGITFFSNPGMGWEYLLAGGSGGLIAAAFAGRLRSREAISKLGVIVGLVQGGIYFLIKLVVSSSAGTIWSAVLPDSILYGLSGVAWFIIALGVSPYLERFFDLITPIRLAELSNPNLPLLKRLATEAPGTFQHTMFVASLAEAAARALNCNVELVRAGTLYHDIGKMHDPLGFIENQMGGPNKHDSLNDPWLSAEIIKKHVSEGLVMAKKYGLPKAIRDFIPQHQGTLLIAYFYHQAKQLVAENSSLVLRGEDFRYAGPIPQSKEAGIMMLADGCEAALRSLKDATSEQALSTVKKIFKARWQDRQLADSGLKYEELPVIAEVFVRVWQQFNHKRIAYPKDST